MVIREWIMRSKRLHRGVLLIIVTLFVLGEASLESNAKASDKPNIVLILADDLGVHQLGCYGSDFYDTPNVDRLAAEGMRFTNAYAACHVCSPTRASIMTGKYPARLGITDFIPGQKKGPEGARLVQPKWHMRLELEEVTVAESLKSAGYATGHFGKWHLNVDKNQKNLAGSKPGMAKAMGAEFTAWRQDVGAQEMTKR
jgi:arylsulfatase A